MAVDFKRIGYIKTIIEELLDSYNPTKGETLSGEAAELISSLTPVFQDLILILDIVNDNPDFWRKRQKSRKREFFLTREDLKNVEISEEPVSISKLTFRINETIDQGSMRTLKATQLTAGLVKQGFLEVVTENNNNQEYKIATAKGVELGISTDIKENSIGDTYSLNLYNANAQRYITTNIIKIILASK